MGGRGAGGGPGGSRVRLGDARCVTPEGAGPGAAGSRGGGGGCPELRRLWQGVCRHSPFTGKMVCRSRGLAEDPGPGFGPVLPCPSWVASGGQAASTLSVLGMPTSGSEDRRG